MKMDATASLVRDEHHERSTRTASLGLAGVVLFLAVFSIMSAYETQKWVDRVQSNASLLQAYLDSTAAILAAESSELEFRLEPSPATRDEFTRANGKIDDAVRVIAARGDRQDAELANLILGLHARYRDTSVRLFAAMDAGDVGLARSIDIDEGDPLVEAMRESITQATSQHAVEAESTLVTMRTIAQLMLVIVPVVFALGFALMLALWRILEGYRRATRKTYDEIEQLSKLRGEFVSTVSHEFRTPLTGIQGFSEIIRDEELTIPEIREYAGDINKGARRLARLISDMLDLDRMESGLVTPTLVPVDLNLILTETAMQFRMGAAKHPIELDLEPGLPQLMGDPDGLTQVATNLLSNAIKYSPDGAAVEVRTRRDAKTIMLTVRDHGMGMPADQLDKIFERYSRIESAATRNIQGTGLGLPIVRQLVQLHRGRVWATSESGQGSVFHVQLPLAAATFAPHGTQPQPQVRAA